MLEGFASADSKNSPPQDAALSFLERQIKLHVKHDRGESLLARGLGLVGSLNKKNDQSLQVLRGLAVKAAQEIKAGDRESFSRTREEIESRIRQDQENLGWKDEITHYTGGFLKTASLFLRGPIGMAGTVAMHGLDQAKLGDSWGSRLSDLTLGGIKGGGMKFLMDKIGTTQLDVATKGATMGLANSLLEVGFSRNSYRNKATGELSAAAGLRMIVDTIFDWRARLVDAGTFAAAHGISGIASRFTAGAIERSHFLNTICTGGSFGLSTGASNEISRQKQSGEEFNLGKILKRALLQGGLDMLAAGPGGLHAAPLHGPGAHLRTTDSSPPLGGRVEQAVVSPEIEHAFGRVERVLNIKVGKGQAASLALQSLEMSPPASEARAPLLEFESPAPETSQPDRIPSTIDGVAATAAKPRTSGRKQASEKSRGSAGTPERADSERAEGSRALVDFPTVARMEQINLEETAARIFLYAGKEVARAARFSKLIEGFKEEFNARTRERLSKQNLPESILKVQISMQQALMFQQIERLLRNPQEGELTLEQRKRLAEQILFQAIRPYENVRQGKNMTCALATLEKRLYAHQPSVIARIITDIVLTGKFEVSDKGQRKTIDMRPNMAPGGLLPDADARAQPMIDLDSPLQHIFDIHRDLENVGRQRSHASQITQMALANAHWQSVAVDPEGKPVTPGDIRFIKRPLNHSFSPEEELLVGPDGSSLCKSPSISDGAAVRIYQLVTGTHETGFALSRGAASTASATGQFSSLIELVRMLNRLQAQGKFPLYLAVNALNEPFIGGHRASPTFDPRENYWHAIALCDLDRAAGDAIVSNHWGRETGLQRIPLTHLFEATIAPIVLPTPAEYEKTLRVLRSDSLQKEELAKHVLVLIQLIREDHMRMDKLSKVAKMEPDRFNSHENEEYMRRATMSSEALRDLIEIERKLKEMEQSGSAPTRLLRLLNSTTTALARVVFTRTYRPGLEDFFETPLSFRDSRTDPLVRLMRKELFKDSPKRSESKDLLNRSERIWKYPEINIRTVSAGNPLYDLGADLIAIDRKTGNYSLINYTGGERGRRLHSTRLGYALAGEDGSPSGEQVEADTILLRFNTVLTMLEQQGSPLNLIQIDPPVCSAHRSKDAAKTGGAIQTRPRAHRS